MHHSMELSNAGWAVLWLCIALIPLVVFGVMRMFRDDDGPKDDGSELDGALKREDTSSPEPERPIYAPTPGYEQPQKPYKPLPRWEPAPLVRPLPKTPADPKPKHAKSKRKPRHRKKPSAQ